MDIKPASTYYGTPFAAMTDAALTIAAARAWACSEMDHILGARAEKARRTARVSP